jgi:hypothetical protein
MPAIGRAGDDILFVVYTDRDEKRHISRRGSPAGRNAAYGYRSRTLNQNRRVKARVDRAKIDATTEADIHRHMIADGQEASDLTGFAPVIPPLVAHAP